MWIDADGASITLAVAWDVQGRGLPPARFETEQVPEQPGERLRAVRHQAREFVLPVWIDGSTESLMWQAVRSLGARMDPTRGDGRIRVTTAVGDQREITCRVQGGFELAERLGEMSGPLVQKAVVSFRASDPYWYDTSDTIVTYQLSGSVATFFPFFPLRLASSEVFADDTINNLGDVDTWPVWTITGPGSAITLRNLTTGKLLTLTGVTLGAGETVTIDTRPGQKAVYRNDGTNLYGSLTSTSSLWNLQRGQNAVRVEMGSATTDSSVRLARRHRYLVV